MPANTETSDTSSRRVRRRLHLGVRMVLLTAVVTAPLLLEWKIANAGQRYASQAVPAAAYRAARSPLIDELLPAGAGGTHFVSTLPDAGGLAIARSALIVVALRDAETYELEGTEIHERAHLLHAAQDTLVQVVMGTLGAPDPSTYAAKNAGEHFAEMAKEAWRLLNPPGVCLAESAEEQLAVADSLVPGTAGFVLYFLRHPTLSALPDAEAWRTAAAKRTAHASAAWERLFAAIERRRLPTGALESWPVPSRREWLAAERRRMRAEGTLLARAQSLSLWPGAAMLQLLDR